MGVIQVHLCVLLSLTLKYGTSQGISQVSFVFQSSLMHRQTLSSAWNALYLLFPTSANFCPSASLWLKQRPVQGWAPFQDYLRLSSSNLYILRTFRDQISLASSLKPMNWKASRLFQASGPGQHQRRRTGTSILTVLIGTAVADIDNQYYSICVKSYVNAASRPVPSSYLPTQKAALHLCYVGILKPSLKLSAVTHNSWLAGVV